MNSSDHAPKAGHPPAMELRVQPGGPLRGRLQVPGDKSISHRALMLGAIASGTSAVSGLLAAEDVAATRAALEAMAVPIRNTAAGIEIDGVGLRGLEQPARDLDMGNSGTAMRLLSGILSGQRFTTRLVGDESLSARPMRRIIEPLTLMGARIQGTGDKPPLTISPAPVLQGMDYRSPVASAQVKSCVLLAGLYATGTTAVFEPHPSRDHTERMLAAFGCPVERSGQGCRVTGGAPLTGTRILIPGDFSSAAFFVVAASVLPESDISLEGVGINPRRSGLLTILRAMGGDIECTQRPALGGEPVADLRVRYAPLKGIEVAPQWVAGAIDEFPILFVAAALADGETRIRGAAELRVKESDRIAVMCRGLAALGADLEERPDGAIIRGGARLHGATVDAAGDHRCAMSLALAGLRSSAPVRVTGAANVATSYPSFDQHARQLGAPMTACGRPDR